MGHSLYTQRQNRKPAENGTKFVYPRLSRLFDFYG